MIQSVSENTAVFFNLPGGLTVERLRTQGGWPKLGGKAAQLRHCARFASEVAGQHDSGSAHDRRRLAVVQLLVRFYDLVEHGDMFFNSAQCRDLVSIGRNLPVLYSQLAAEAAAAGKKLWKAQPKLHLFLPFMRVADSLAVEPSHVLDIRRRGPRGETHRGCIFVSSFYCSFHCPFQVASCFF